MTRAELREQLQLLVAEARARTIRWWRDITRQSRMEALELQVAALRECIEQIAGHELAAIGLVQELQRRLVYYETHVRVIAAARESLDADRNNGILLVKGDVDVKQNGARRG